MASRDPSFDDLTGWRRQSILVVDDDPAVRELLYRLLTKEGFAVMDAQDGAQALKLAESQERIDLLITDIVMRQMNGVELAALLRERHPLTAVLFTSGYTPKQLAKLNMPEGADFIEKPWSSEQIIEHALRLIGPKHPNIAD
ncbi:MAG TPA: response regulator [Longimicrobiales bacterium]|nr:response regulator [Longimicrobiales bacterium]